jgi:hypothetical protein
MFFIASGEGAFFSGLSGAYWSGEEELDEEELCAEVCDDELWPDESCGDDELWPDEFCGDELWLWALPKEASISASTPAEKMRITERMVYTFSPDTLRPRPVL